MVNGLETCLRQPNQPHLIPGEGDGGDALSCDSPGAGLIGIGLDGPDSTR